ncbi:hypothetical protein NEDG_01657 [Nematocida displodere]|uniref:Uncharacterized protein n=1 Tax=Nematocida displodere TaxID=1805483 RepID=A0A177EGZ4_9MICR|nr:hypothetical protein NEDG_01657 [Nematocida displodere]
MGLVLGRRSSVREVIQALETTIEHKQKEIKRAKHTSKRLIGFLSKTAILLNLLSVAVVWVCKEAMSFKTLIKGFGAVVALDLSMVVLGGLISRVYGYRVSAKTRALEALKTKQRKNIEDLKRETKYYETHGIIEKYERPVFQEEEPEEDVVEKIVSFI